MISQTIAKPSYVKTKAFGLCGTLALATALLIGAGSVSADETTQPVVDAQPAVSNVYTADNAGNVTVTPSETATETPKVLAPAPIESQPIAEIPATTTEVAQPVAETPAAPTTVTKQGDTINVENPNVQVDFPNGTGKYSPFKVEYKDIEIPDDIPVNEGDKVVTELPKEIGLQTNFDFDVYNNENVVGKANADAQTRKITTTFNNYFTEHPLNKKMSLAFDAKWLDIVEPGKPVTVNFNGTVKTFNIAEEGPLPTDELLSKWGSQNKDNPQIINWTLRLNTARQVLEYAKLKDTWSDNQEFIEGSQNIYFVEDPVKWTGIDYSAKDYLESWNVRADGFDAKFKTFNRIMYIDYQTRLKNAVKDSANPTNKAELVAVDAGAKSSSKVQLVGGRGDASGENKPEPTFEIPHDAPKVDIPEFEGGIPGIPEVRELPEYTEPIGTVPNEAPKYDKPEFNGGIPGIPEERELPPFEGGVVPHDAPILDLPELHIPEKPVAPKEAPNKLVDAPKTKEVEITEVVYKNDSEPKEVANTTVYGGVLPSTGEKEGIMSTLGLAVIAVGIAGLTLSFKKYNEGEGE
ncbi:LPXTG cell wall anchor domain-containing protein [Streptococcus phage YMC-2011]|uniref:LPXTG cell wall anchor domain-containing protein n=1 Tax=Streptococcus phage YMC-2011 TaxID=1051631 RepID=UPI000217A925|nr:LPXTG cell wall anchor domain-containing protein [Streptococcus phage YMC-2011]AEJ54387.1 lpxtg cell wall surface protein, collagen binding domain protein [Streptococcus phage YMC-2011]